MVVIFRSKVLIDSVSVLLFSAILLFDSSSILSHLIWYNKNIKINSKQIYLDEFAKQNIFLHDLFNTENEFRSWDEIKIRYDLSDNSYFKKRKIISSIPKTWQKVLKENQSNSSNLALLDYQLLKDNSTLVLYRLKI